MWEDSAKLVRDSFNPCAQQIICFQQIFFQVSHADYSYSETWQWNGCLLQVSWMQWGNRCLFVAFSEPVICNGGLRMQTTFDKTVYPCKVCTWHLHTPCLGLGMLMKPRNVHKDILLLQDIQELRLNLWIICRRNPKLLFSVARELFASLKLSLRDLSVHTVSAGYKGFKAVKQ